MFRYYWNPVLVPLTMLIGGCALLALLLAYLGADPPLGAVARLLTMPAVLVLIGGISWLLAWRWEGRRHWVRMQYYLAALRSWEERYYCARCHDTFAPMPAAASTYTGQTIRLTPSMQGTCSGLEVRSRRAGRNVALSKPHGCSCAPEPQVRGLTQRVEPRR